MAASPGLTHWAWLWAEGGPEKALPCREVGARCVNVPRAWLLVGGRVTPSAAQEQVGPAHRNALPSLHCLQLLHISPLSIQLMKLETRVLLYLFFKPQMPPCAKFHSPPPKLRTMPASLCLTAARIPVVSTSSSFQSTPHSAWPHHSSA